MDALYFVTFGQRYREEQHPAWPHVHPDGWITIEAPDYTAARQRVVELFGRHFCDIYTTSTFDDSLFTRGELVRLRLSDELPESSEDRWPDHYRDDGQGSGLCSWSGSPRPTPTTPCPNGCDGSLWHYSNDGHPGCDEPLAVTP